MQIEARKLYADDKGNEKTAPLDEQMEIGLLMSEPSLDVIAPKDIVLLERHAIRSGPQTLRLVANAKPKFAVIDPFTRWIDRDSNNNSKPIE